MWIVDPEEKTIKVVNSNGENDWNNPTSDEILLSTVLKDLRIRIKWIWDRKNFPSNYVIKKMLNKNLEN